MWFATQFAAVTFQELLTLKDVTSSLLESLFTQWALFLEVLADGGLIRLAIRVKKIKVKDHQGYHNAFDRFCWIPITVQERAEPELCPITPKGAAATKEIRISFEGVKAIETFRTEAGQTAVLEMGDSPLFVIGVKKQSLAEYLTHEMLSQLLTLSHGRIKFVGGGEILHSDYIVVDFGYDLPGTPPVAKQVALAS